MLPLVSSLSLRWGGIGFFAKSYTQFVLSSYNQNVENKNLRR